MRVPAALVAIPLLAGCAAGVLTIDRQPDLFPLLTAASALIAWLAAAQSCADESAGECCGAVIVAAGLVGLSLGADAAARAYISPVQQWFASLPDDVRGDPVVVEGVLVEDAAVLPTGASMAVRVAGLRQGSRDVACRTACGGVRVSISGVMTAVRAGEWRAGRRVRFPAALRYPTVYRNPGVPDDRRALERRGMALVGAVKSAALVEVIARGSRVDEAAARVRAWARDRLAAAVGRWSTRSAAVAVAILVGDRTGLPDVDEDRLQRAGTYHVIAISGGNIAILAALLLILLERLPLPPRFAPMAAIGALLFYGRIAGGAASVDRAVTVAVIYLAARAADRPGPALNAVAVACVLALAVAPVVVLDAGFILSFGATVAIVVGVPRLVAPRRRVRGRAARLLRDARLLGAGLLAATICADLALTPAAATMFSRVTFAGLLLNFVAIPLMAAVQAGALAVLACADAAPRFASSLGYGVHLAAAALVDSSRLVDYLPWLVRDVLAPAWWVVAAYYSSLVAAVSFPRIRRGALTVTVVSGVAVVTGLPATSADALPAAARGTLRLAVLDVGQGDSTVVVLPGGRALVVDAGGLAGGAFDIGERVVLPALRALRVRRADTFVITHGDPDHIGGAPAVLRAARPRAVWEGIPVPPHGGLQAVAEAAAGSGAVWRFVQAGDAERAAGVELSVLHPPPPDWERQRVRNEDSVVLEIRIGEVAIILPGDIGTEGERAIRPRLARAKTLILKAPHHGSATSSTNALLDALDPAAVIFSAGRGNRFGHPHPAVVERYRSRGTHIFGTYDDGAVIVETNGKDAVIRGWYSGREISLGSQSR